MTIANYGILVGQVTDSVAETGTDSPHFQVLVHAGSVDFRLAVNVMSQQSPSQLLYLADEAFAHPILEELASLADGFTPLVSQPGGVALDYIRANLFDRTKMVPLPAEVSGPDNDLEDKLAHYVDRAIGDPDSRVFAFGQRWGPEPSADKIFHFSPGNGVHDIHMNQGNSGSFTDDDGVWQDGGLLFHYPGSDQWVAVFLAFQSQAWHTDDHTGHASPDVPSPAPSPSEPDFTVRIVGAMVNPVGGSPEHETVTLLNATAAAIDLTGWAIADRLKRATTLSSVMLAAGDAVRVTVAPPTALSNDGGLITVLDPTGLKVDGISYTKAQASAEGCTIVF